jgi:hypothetical protein
MPRYNKETHEQFNLILTKDDMHKMSTQAKQLGLKPTEYIRLIISLDASTGIIERLKLEQERQDAKERYAELNGKMSAITERINAKV